MRALKRGEMLDGEGGFLVWGKQTPAAVPLAQGYLPLGLANGVKLNRDIAEGEPLRWSDVAFDPTDPAVQVRREMEGALPSACLMHHAYQSACLAGTGPLPPLKARRNGQKRCSC
jgi:predicted homoserine dehydrogenase-like protein